MSRRQRPSCLSSMKRVFSETIKLINNFSGKVVIHRACSSREKKSKVMIQKSSNRELYDCKKKKKKKIWGTMLLFASHISLFVSVPPLSLALLACSISLILSPLSPTPSLCLVAISASPYPIISPSPSYSPSPLVSHSLSISLYQSLSVFLCVPLSPTLYLSLFFRSFFPFWFLFFSGLRT